MEELDFQILLDWSVTGRDRLMGAVYHRPGHGEGRRVLTSPVVELTAVGAPPTFVAITQSGSRYCLGLPARRFGQAGMDAFIARRFHRQADLPPAGAWLTEYEDLLSGVAQ
jgi:hypothetical protein